MRLYTYNIPKNPSFHGIKIDTTVKSGVSFLAPTWDIVIGVKSGKITTDEYTCKYLDILQERYDKNPQQFIDLFNNDDVAFGCYCKSGCFCHRYILVEVFSELANINKLQFAYMGEIK